MCVDLTKASGARTKGKFTTYFTRGLAGDSRLTLDYCAELVTNAFRLTPSARRRDAPEDSLLAGGSTACPLHYNGPSAALANKTNRNYQDLTNRGWPTTAGR